MENEIMKAMASSGLDIAVDFSEVALDSILRDGLLRDIPIVGALVSLYKLGSNVQNANFIRNATTFFQELKRNSFSDKSKEMLDRMKCDEAYRMKITDSILLFNARFDEAKKAKYLAKIIIALAERKIDINEYDLICRIIDSLNNNDIQIIIDIAVSQPTPFNELRTRNVYSHEIQLSGLQKLIWLGVLVDDQLTWKTISSIEKRIYKLSEIGNKLYILGIT